MNLGHAIGNVWVTRKAPSLEEKRMLLAQPLYFDCSLKGVADARIHGFERGDGAAGDTVIFSTSPLRFARHESRVQKPQKSRAVSTI
jgi:microcompartment protein CcmK/EutM